MSDKLIESSNFNRRDEVVLSPIGHTNLTHSFLMAKTEQPLCDRCNVVLSIDHIVTYCQKYQVARNKFNIATLKDAAAHNSTDLLDFLREIDVYKLI